LGVWERELEDAVHDVFVVLHRRWEDYDPARPIKPWLAGIATRVASDFRRRSQNRHEVVAEIQDGEMVDQGLSADQVVSRKEDKDLVMRALDSLSEEQRTVFVLHELQGLSMPEIQSAVDAPLNTLYSRLRLARNSFKVAVRRLRPKGGEK
jgi:RNA polymerase sigma-70 factor (ECF subfamily)